MDDDNTQTPQPPSYVEPPYTLVHYRRLPSGEIKFLKSEDGHAPNAFVFAAVDKDRYPIKSDPLAPMVTCVIWGKPSWPRHSESDKEDYVAVPERWWSHDNEYPNWPQGRVLADTTTPEIMAGAVPLRELLRGSDGATLELVEHGGGAGAQSLHSDAASVDFRQLQGGDPELQGPDLRG